jgi:hypothetical protein
MNRPNRQDRKKYHSKTGILAEQAAHQFTDEALLAGDVSSADLVANLVLCDV